MLLRRLLPVLAATFMLLGGPAAASVVTHTYAGTVRGLPQVTFTGWFTIEEHLMPATGINSVFNSSIIDLAFESSDGAVFGRSDVVEEARTNFSASPSGPAIVSGGGGGFLGSYAGTYATLYASGMIAARLGGSETKSGVLWIDGQWSSSLGAPVSTVPLPTAVALLAVALLSLGAIGASRRSA